MLSVFALSVVLNLFLTADSAPARAFVSDPVPLRAAPRLDDVSECQVCVWGLRITEDILGDPVIVSTAALKLATSACPYAPKEQREDCMMFVPVIVSALVSYLEGAYHETLPALMCSPVCAAKAQLALAAQPKNLKGPMECAFCEYVVQALQAALADQTEQDTIMDDARAACKQLPQAMAAVCVQSVDEKGPVLIALLESAEPSGVCTIVSACEFTAAVAPPAELTDLIVKIGRLTAPPMFPGSLAAAPRGLFDNGCEFCKVAVMEIREKMEEPAFQHTLVIYAKRVCERFGPGFSDECSEMVEQYAPLVFSVLISELNPLKLCAMIHLCPTPEPPVTIVEGVKLY